MCEDARGSFTHQLLQRASAGTSATKGFLSAHDQEKFSRVLQEKRVALIVR